MPLVAFEPTIPAFGRAKTVHALDRSATVIAGSYNYDIQSIVSFYSSRTESSDASSPSASVSDNGSRDVATSGLYAIGQI
jgi:hypothetical protein